MRIDASSAVARTSARPSARSDPVAPSTWCRASLIERKVHSRYADMYGMSLTLTIPWPNR